MPKVTEPFVETTSTGMRRRLWAPQDLPLEDDDTCDTYLDDTLDPAPFTLLEPPAHRPRPRRRGVWLLAGTVGMATMFTGLMLVVLAVCIGVAVGFDALDLGSAAIGALP